MYSNLSEIAKQMDHIEHRMSAIMRELSFDSLDSGCDEPPLRRDDSDEDREDMEYIEYDLEESIPLEYQNQLLAKSIHILPDKPYQNWISPRLDTTLPQKGILKNRVLPAKLKDHSTERKYSCRKKKNNQIEIV